LGGGKSSEGERNREKNKLRGIGGGRPSINGKRNFTKPAVGWKGAAKKRTGP